MGTELVAESVTSTDNRHSTNSSRCLVLNRSSKINTTNNSSNSFSSTICYINNSSCNSSSCRCTTSPLRLPPSPPRLAAVLSLSLTPVLQHTSKYQQCCLQPTASRHLQRRSMRRLQCTGQPQSIPRLWLSCNNSNYSNSMRCVRRHHRWLRMCLCCRLNTPHKDSNTCRLSRFKSRPP
jgi:hypothetical protein